MKIILVIITKAVHCRLLPPGGQHHQHRLRHPVRAAVQGGGLPLHHLVVHLPPDDGPGAGLLHPPPDGGGRARGRRFCLFW